jgi:two-component system, NarL family, sensor kinase
MLTNTAPLRPRDRFLIGSTLTLVAALDLFTPVEYVMGYLYLCPLLLTANRLPRRGVLGLALLCVGLVLLDLLLPHQPAVRLSALINRIIASIALIVTAILSARSTTYAQALAQQQTQLKAKSQLEDLREDFAGTLAHDLKTPLLGAISTLDAFIQGQFGVLSAAQTQVLTTMARSHQTSLKLLDSLLDVYRNDTTGLRLQFEHIDLTALVEETANQIADLALHRQIQIVIRDGDSEFRRALWVSADPIQLQRVLMNLLANAINHSRRGTRVEVVLKSQRSRQYVQVLDQGAGLKPEELSQLFQRFYQGKSDRQAKGSGLGLYLARQIITAHHGTIWAENRSPQGAIFSFYLPARLSENSVINVL